MRYISTTETAKLIRAALKKAWPSIKFAVRCSKGSGSAIYISWTDGPSDPEVSAIVGQYQGGRFDGMIDMAYGVESYLLPDGSAMVARDPGTLDQRGTHSPVRAFKPHPDAERVRFCADHVFSKRELSAERIAACERAWGALSLDEQDKLRPKLPYTYRDDKGFRLATMLGMPRAA